MTPPAGRLSRPSRERTSGASLYDRASGKSRTLTEAWDRSPSSIEWMPDGKSLIATASESARVKVFRVDAASGQPQVLIGDHYNSGVEFAGGRSSRLVLAQDSFVSPAEIYVANPDGSNLKPLTHF